MKRAILLVLALLVGAGVMAGCDVATTNHMWWLSSQRCGAGTAGLHIEETWNAYSWGVTHLRATSNDCNDTAPPPIAAGTIGARVDLYDHDGLCKNGGAGYQVNASNSNQANASPFWTGPESCQVNNSWEDYYSHAEHIIEYPNNDFHTGGTNSPVIRFCRGTCA